MVRNKTELLRCANAWVAQAKEDIRNQIVNFIRMSGTSEEQLADALAISREELISIIETNNEISLTTFAKLLIATDNVLEIKPLGQSALANAPRGAMPHSSTPKPSVRQQNSQPRDANGRFTSTRSNSRQNQNVPPMGGIPVDRNGRPLPPPPFGYPMPPMGGIPVDRNGRPLPPPPFGEPRFGGMPGVQKRMAQPTPQVAPVAEVERPLDELSSHTRAELTQMIRDNFWDGEIDLEESTKSELIAFLASKRNAENVEAPQANEDSSMAAFREMLDNAIAENPHLRDVISQYTA